VKFLALAGRGRPAPRIWFFKDRTSALWGDPTVIWSSFDAESFRFMLNGLSIVLILDTKPVRGSMNLFTGVWAVTGLRMGLDSG
jgi:hypothetical protein